MIWWIALAASNLLTATTVYLLAHGIHTHTWNHWDDWIITGGGYTGSETAAVRYRHCTVCGHVQQQFTGRHRCAQHDCTHLKHLNEDAATRRIQRLEGELGL